MPYTLTIFDKCRPEHFYYFENQDKFDVFLRQYLFRQDIHERATELGYGDIFVISFQELINLIWDIYNEDDSDCFHCMVRYDGKYGELLTKEERYILIYHNKQYIEKIEILSAEKLKSTLRELIKPNIDIKCLGVPYHWISLDNLIQMVYKTWNNGDEGKTIFKLDHNDNAIKIPDEND